MSEQDAVNEELAAEAVGLHIAEAGSRLQEGPQARRSRPWLRPRQDVGSWPQGLQLARRRQAARSLRGRPEPAPHADAQAARPEQEDVDAVRDVPDAHAAREPGRSRAALRRRRRRSAWTSCKATGLAKTRDVPVKILGRGELTKKFTVHAHKFSASRARGASRAPAAPSGHRGLSEARHDLHDLQSFRVAEIRNKILFTMAILAVYRLGSFIPCRASTSTPSSRSRTTTPAASSAC